MIKKILCFALSACMALMLMSCSVTENPKTSDLDSRIYIYTGAEKILRDEQPEENGKDLISVKLAKNEYESGQFVINTNEEMKYVSVSVGDLRSDKGNIISKDRIALYRQYYTHIKQSEAATELKEGYYPDAIVPLNEKNNFCTVQPDKNQGYWLTVQSKTEDIADLYKGDIYVSYDGGEIKIPLEVEIWDFEIPITPSLPNYMGVWYWSVKDLFDNMEVDYSKFDYDKYSKDIYELMVTHRLSPSEFPGKFEDYATDPRLSAFRVGNSDKESMEKTIKFLKDNNILHKAFYYIVDEPEASPEGTQSVIDAYNSLASHEIPLLVTTAPNGISMLGYVDIWCPLTYVYDEEIADTRRDEGEKVWWYNCLAPTYPYPSFHINDRLISSRLQYWMQRDYKVDGFLYWTSTFWSVYDGEKYTGESLDLWAEDTPNQIHPGDGYLLYPGWEGDGRAEADIPIPTIRLEAIRDGAEDYEYLILLENKISEKINELGLDITVEQAMDSYYKQLYRSLSSFDTDPDRLVALREQIAHDIMYGPDAIILSDFDYTGDEYNKYLIKIYTDKNSDITINGLEAEKTIKENCNEFLFSVNAEVRDVLLLIRINKRSDSRLINYIISDNPVLERMKIIDMDAADITDKLKDNNNISVAKTDDGRHCLKISFDSNRVKLKISDFIDSDRFSDYTHLRFHIKSPEKDAKLQVSLSSSTATFNDGTVYEVKAGEDIYIDLSLTQGSIPDFINKLSSIGFNYSVNTEIGTKELYLLDLSLINLEKQ